LADTTTKPVLTGEYKKDELLEASRSGNEEKLVSKFSLNMAQI
jgi:tankyrase